MNEMTPFVFEDDEPRDANRSKVYTNEADLKEGFDIRPAEWHDTDSGMFFMGLGAFTLGAIILILSKRRK